LELGSPEILFIIFLLLIIFGPDKLPEIARRIGFYYRKLNEYRRMLDEEFRKAMMEVDMGGTQPTKSSRVKSSKDTAIDEDLKKIAEDLGIDHEGKSREELVKEIRLKLLERHDEVSDDGGDASGG
jgi:Sec-independent protein translocase protein TatA